MSVVDMNTPFVVDADTREIINKEHKKKVLIQGDHNSERFTFEIPRFIEGKDVGKCNSVQIHYINVGKGGQNTGVYTVTDLNVYEFIHDILNCSWLISRNATKYEGTLSFMIRFAEIVNETEIKYAWHTEAYEGIKVAKNIDAAEDLEEEYVDVIAQWKRDVLAEMHNYVDAAVESSVDIATKELVARLDNLAKVEGEGLTDAEKELVDIRVDADGIAYDNAGAAMRSGQRTRVNYITDDLNNYVEPMIGVAANTATNVPTNGSGVLVVERTKTAKSGSWWVIQRWYMINQNQSYWRVLIGDNWSKWFGTNIAFDKLIEDDLNLYKAGNFHGIVTVNAKNRPVESSGMIDVFEYGTGTNTWVKQTFTAINTEAVYVRHFNKSWSKWFLLTEEYQTYFTEDLDTYISGNKRGIVSAGTANIPINELGCLEVETFGTGAANWVKQTFYGMTSGKVFYRTCKSNGAWTKWFETGVVELPKHRLAGKNIVFIGDSIFGNNRTATGVTIAFASITGANIYNFALGGTRGKARTDSYKWSQFDGENLAKAIASGDYSEQVAMLETMTDEPFYFESVITEMQNFDFSTVDYMICNYGTNDWTGGHSTETYHEGISSIIETILTAYPNIIFIKCTPTERFVLDGEDRVSGAVHKNATSGITLKELANEDADIANEYNIPLIDLYNIGVNTFTKDIYFSDGDYTHHNEVGRKRIAEILSEKIV